jgi:acetyl esterase
MASLPFDAEMAHYLDEMARLQGPWGEDWPISRQRQAWEDHCRRVRARRPERLLVEDLDVDGIHVRIFRPPGEDPKPGMLHAHGGGWTMGSCETHDDLAAEIADQADVVSVLFDYRLAPEHPHPAQVEDMALILDWVRSTGRAIGIDPRRIVATGDSAGGQVAAGLALALKKEGPTPLRGLVLINPGLGADLDTPSHRANANAPGLTRAEVRDYLSAFLGPRDLGNWSDPTALPNLATDVSGLPPCFITAAAHDPLYDDGVTFFTKLKAAGIPSALREEPALAHSYWRARHHSRAAMAGFKAIVEAVRQLGHEGLLPAQA